MIDLRKMKAPIAENLESGQTCELYECFSPKIERIGKSVTNTVLAICAHISRNILLNDQPNVSGDCGGALLWKRLLRRDDEGKEGGCHELHITLVLLEVLSGSNFVRVDFITRTRWHGLHGLKQGLNKISEVVISMNAGKSG